MNKRAKEIADMQRIERGYYEESDKLLKFETIKKHMSKMEQESFDERIKLKLEMTPKPVKKPNPSQKPPKKDKVKNG